jgi:hypothetical protein
MRTGAVQDQPTRSRDMTLRLLPIALLAASPVAAQTAPEPAPLSLQQASALKCSAAFALGAAMQARGQGTQWPALGERGREFMVQASAKIMDETGWSRDLVAIKAREQAAALATPAALDAAMTPCLLLLDASGL